VKSNASGVDEGACKYSKVACSTITELPKALETSKGRAAEVAKILGLVGVTMSEVNSIPEHQECILEVTELPKALEGAVETVTITGLMRVAMRSEVDSIREH